MKVTLENPPEGFGEAATFINADDANIGNPYLRPDGSVGRISAAVQVKMASGMIILTPKKREYWRLDPVATFEEATPGTHHSYHLAIMDGEVSSYLVGQTGVQWLKLTECEE